MDMNGIWNAYMGLKRNRRERERDDAADDRHEDLLRQQSLSNANVERAYNYGVARDAQQDSLAAEALAYSKQRDIDQDQIAADKFLADEAWRVTSDENSDQDYQLGVDNAAATLAQRGIDNARNVKTDARSQTTADEATVTHNAGLDTAAAADNAVRFRGLMTQMSTSGMTWDDVINSPGGSSQLEQIVRTSPYLRKVVKDGGNADYEPHSLDSVQTGVDAQGQPIMAHALMIQVGQNEDGSPILKPYSQYRGTDDAVPYLGTDQTMGLLEQIVLGGTAKGTQSGINSAAEGLAAAVSNSAKQPTALGQVPVVTPTATTTTTRTDPASLGAGTKPLTDEAITLNLGSPQPVGLDTTTQPDTGTGRGTSVPNPEEIQQGRVISQIASSAIPQDYAEMTWTDKDRIDSEVISQIGSELDVSRTKATRLYGQWQSTGGLNGVVGEDSKSRFNGFGKKLKPKPTSKLTASETKGLQVFDSALTLDTGTNQAIANKAAKNTSAEPTETQINAAEADVQKELDPATPVDTSSKGIAKRAAIWQVLTNAGLVPALDETQAANWFANATLGANTLQQTTIGNNVVTEEFDSFSQKLGDEANRSPAALTRDAAEATAAATKAGKAFTRAVQMGAANGMGEGKDSKGKPTGYYGNVAVNNLPGYMTQMFETNADIFASIVPKGMDINNMTGTPRENAVVAALTSAAVQALKDGYYDGTNGRAGSAAGNIMPLLALYPPASDTGVYVFGGQIHYLEDKVKHYAAANSATEQQARRALKQIYGEAAAKEKANNIKVKKAR